MHPGDPRLPQPPKGAGVFTLREVAPLIGVSHTYLYRLAKEDRLPFKVVRIGDMIRVPRHVLHDYMREVGILSPDTAPPPLTPEDIAKAERDRQSMQEIEAIMQRGNEDEIRAMLARVRPDLSWDDWKNEG